MAVKLVYHDRYNFNFLGLEKLHPFPADKFRQIRQALLTSGTFSDKDFVEPRLDEKLVLDYLLPHYIQKLEDKNTIASCLELPWLRAIPYSLIHSRLMVPMLLASCGTVAAAFLAMEYGMAVNLGGGFHHACFEKGGGFCLYPDIPIAIRELRKSGRCRRIAVIDCDAHQGDGTERALGDDPDIFMVDIYEAGIFPNDREAMQFIDIDIGVGAVEDRDYLDGVERIVLPAVDRFHPDLIIFGAGTDVYEKDPLTHIRLTREGIVRRDGMIISFAREQRIPLTMVLSGGYHRDSAGIIAESIIRNF